MQLTHFDENGKAIMVDVTEKNDTVREATAKGRILVSREVYDAIEAGTVGNGGRARSGNNCRNYGCKENFRTDSDVPYSSNHKMPCEFRDETRGMCN